MLSSLILLLISVSLAEDITLHPLSKCNKARTTHYEEWRNNGHCQLGPKSDVVVPGYIYKAAVNQLFFANGTKCGVCYEMVGPKGVAQFRIEDLCPADDKNLLCHADMIHFDLSENGYYVITDDYKTYSNISFRMVACTYDTPISVYTLPTSSK